MEKLSRTEKFKEYRNSIQNDSEHVIRTDELKDLQQRIIEVEKRFGNTSKTETDMNRGYKTSSSANDAYNIFDDQVQTIRPEEVKEDDSIFVPVSEKDGHQTIDAGLKEEKNKNDDFEKALKDLLTKTVNKEEDGDVDDYISKIKALFNTDEKEEVKVEVEEEPKEDAKEETIEEIKEEVKEEVKEEPNAEIKEEEKVEPVAPIFADEPEYVPSPKSDTDSIPSVEKLIDEINSIQTVEEEEAQAEQEKEMAEFVEEKKEEIIESVLKDIKLEKPVLKPLEPKEDHSKEFIELCEGVNRLAKEIESRSTFDRAPYVPPRPELPEASFEALKSNIQNDIEKDKEANSFMDQLKEEVKAFNESNENVTINTLKDELIEEQRHKEKVENPELKEEFETTVNSEVSKLLDEISATKPTDIPVDVLSNVETVEPAPLDLNEGKTIAFDNEEEINEDVNKGNTIVLSNPYSEQASSNDASIHTMSFETEELYEDEEKSSTVLNVILTVLIVLAVAALAVIAYFFLLTRGII